MIDIFRNIEPDPCSVKLLSLTMCDTGIIVHGGLLMRKGPTKKWWGDQSEGKKNGRLPVEVGPAVASLSAVSRILSMLVSEIDEWLQCERQTSEEGGGADQLSNCVKNVSNIKGAGDFKREWEKKNLLHRVKKILLNFWGPFFPTKWMVVKCLYHQFTDYYLNEWLM